MEISNNSTQQQASDEDLRTLPPYRTGTRPGKIQANVKLQYPYNDKYTYETYLERIDLDAERQYDLTIGNGFVISEPKGIKKDVKLQNGIFSSRYGSTLADVDSFNGKYRCKCGFYKGSILHGEICPNCHTMVKFYDDDVSIFGWLILKEPYKVIIHPNIYRTLESFIGAARLNRIIDPVIEVDSDGKIIQSPIDKNEPFKGIGLFAFKERYQEILDFYYAKYPNKTLYYNDLVKNINITFTKSIAVFSALLRPSKLEAGSLRYEITNQYYQLLARLVYECNKDKRAMDRKEKEKTQQLYDIQYNYNCIYEELKEVLSRKKGDFRAAIGGRYSFSGRSVIRQDPTLHADEIKLSFHMLLEMLQQVIINILVKSHNMTYPQAYKKWYKCVVKGYDKTVYDLVDGLIKDSNGLPILINRNPTISYGGILRCRCIGINMNYTMSISLIILKPLAADFDGDSLNIMYLYNKQFIEMTNQVFNPIQLYISRDDGECNADLLPSRDMLINANALKNISEYSEQEKDNIRALQNSTYGVPITSTV